MPQPHLASYATHFLLEIIWASVASKESGPQLDPDPDLIPSSSPGLGHRVVCGS